MPLPTAASLAAFAKRFADDRSGNFAITTGVCAMAIMLCSGVALDYSRISATKAALNGALDAALLATGREASEGVRTDIQLRAWFEDYFYANLDGRNVDSAGVEIVSFSVNKADGTVSAKVSTDFELSFMKLAGRDSVPVSSDAAVSYSSANVELAMMLDVTGSMNERGKIAALRTAATNAIDILLPANAPKGRTRISLVPYSVSVNAGPFARKATGQTQTPFVTERWGNEKFTDAAPAQERLAANASYGPAQAIVPLSSDPAVLKSTIASFTGIGGTAGHLGVAWSYYTLSPEWRGVWPAQSKPANYRSANVRKIALLMTDGEFNTIYAPAGSRYNSSSFAVELCKSMKRDGIVVYAIAFDAPAAARATLEACATPDTATQQFYYSASSGVELTAAFEEIATDIRKLRITR